MGEFVTRVLPDWTFGKFVMFDAATINRSILQLPCLTDFAATAKFRKSFSLLLEANDYAHRTDCSLWEFAVEAAQLLRLGLSHNDLRFLVRMRIVDFAQELTSPDQMSRRFQPTPGFSITKQTCFVLTKPGIAVALECVTGSRNLRKAGIAQRMSTDKLPRIPDWNTERRILTLDDKVVKRFRWRAFNQELVLSAFQEEHWPSRILDPLAPHHAQDAKRRLSDTIKCLNRGRENDLVQFHGDGTGQGVVWQLNPSADL